MGLYDDAGHCSSHVYYGLEVSSFSVLDFTFSGLGVFEVSKKHPD